ncbi:hypothetical protein HELRODRAFT_193850 [Helobdella robusta]|uniref:DRBM domain-containing protein n=1 Tax=Helobdella robusta TaxID=6412 RepID=T1FVF0_HELRO|nr:hypothetical protein HELRODRAFT_193850 [Helobdella robusta]ESN94140.1 hypothetical protein HELRODRAFT_193850 [Helobdella robusta]
MRKVDGHNNKHNHDNDNNIINNNINNINNNHNNSERVNGCLKDQSHPSYCLDAVQSLTINTAKIFSPPLLSPSFSTTTTSSSSSSSSSSSNHTHDNVINNIINTTTTTHKRQTKDTNSLMWINEELPWLRASVVSVTGPKHAPLFTAQMTLRGKTYEASGPTKKMARLNVASAVALSLSKFKRSYQHQDHSVYHHYRHHHQHQQQQQLLQGHEDHFRRDGSNKLIRWNAVSVLNDLRPQVKYIKLQHHISEESSPLHGQQQQQQQPQQQQPQHPNAYQHQNAQQYQLIINPFTCDFFKFSLSERKFDSYTNKNVKNEIGKNGWFNKSNNNNQNNNRQQRQPLVTVSLNVDNETFIGSGPCIRIAKQKAAKLALKTLFNLENLFK